MFPSSFSAQEIESERCRPDRGQGQCPLSPGIRQGVLVAEDHAEANGHLFKVAKGIGSTRWHRHDDQDELFVLYRGHLTIHLRDRDIELGEDDLFVVPKGVEHCPEAHGEVAFLIAGLNVTSNVAGGKPDV
ncbi:cupin domain-containing protein [Novimethylophilus sp.]|uniref:cupin domain-containing protein n=1 Tax=Novimethylophilus sp. TaxID=2137426 RepID=UPI0039C919A0